MSKPNSKTTADCLQWSEARLLIKGLYRDGDYRMSLLVGCGCYYGLRIAELLGLTWEDVLRKEDQPFYNCNTGEEYNLRVNGSFKEHILKCCKVLKINNKAEYCFLNRYGGVISCQMVNRKLKWYKVKYRLSIENFSTHTFRKTWARKIYEDELSNGEGENILIRLSASMNHSSSVVTREYIGLGKRKQININADYLIENDHPV